MRVVPCCLPVNVRLVSHASSDRLRRLGLRPRAIFNGARPRGSAGSRVHATARRIRIRRRVAVLRDPARPRGFRSACGGETSRVRTSGGVRRPSRSLGLAPAPRAGSPVACAAFRAAMLRRPDTASSPRGVLRRASAEPRRRVSLSSALGPSPCFLSSGCRSDASQPPQLACFRKCREHGGWGADAEAKREVRRLRGLGGSLSEGGGAGSARMPRSAREARSGIPRRRFAGRAARRRAGRARRPSGCEPTSPKKRRTPGRRTPQEVQARRVSGPQRDGRLPGEASCAGRAPDGVYAYDERGADAQMARVEGGVPLPRNSTHADGHQHDGAPQMRSPLTRYLLLREQGNNACRDRHAEGARHRHDAALRRSAVGRRLDAARRL